MGKEDEIFDLMKLPDSVIIKELRIELGKANAMIQELEDTISSLNTSEDVLNIIKGLKGTIKALIKERNENKFYLLYKELKTEYNRLRNQNGELIGQVFRLKEKLKDYGQE